MRLPAWLIVARWRVDVCAAAVWALAAGAVWMLAVRPLLDHAAEAERQQSELASLSEQQETAKTQLADLQRRSALATKQLSAASVRPAPLESQNQRQADLTALAEAIGQSTSGGLRVDQLAWSAPVKGSRYTAVGLRIAGSAGYVACREFLNAIHSKFPDTGVVAFKLAGSPDVPGAAAALVVELIWYAAPAGATKAAAAPVSSPVPSPTAPATPAKGG